MIESRTYENCFLNRLKQSRMVVKDRSFSLQERTRATEALKQSFGNAPAPSDVVFVGAGGVASWFLPQYLKTLFAFKTATRDTTKTTITIYDYDVVEERNLLRQNFISCDVGRNKAQVLSERYNDIYEDIDVCYIPKYFLFSSYVNFIYDFPVFPKMKQYIKDNEDHFETGCFPEVGRGLHLFNFVDNEFSKHMLDYFISYYDLNFNNYFSYYCTGCEVSNGQVFVNKTKVSKFYTEYYKDVSFNDLDETLEERVSCAELAEHAALEQTFDSNTLAANLLNILVNNNLKNFWGNRTQEIKFVCSGTPSVETITNNDVLLVCDEYCYRVYNQNLSTEVEEEVTVVEAEETVTIESDLSVPVYEEPIETPNRHINLGLFSRT